MKQPKDPIYLAWLSLAAICVIWGTTYTLIKVGVSEFSPYLMAGIRQTGAGVLLLLWARISGVLRPASTAYLLKQATAGLFMIAGGNGLITWGMQYVSSGLSAVIGSLTPVVVALISLIWQDKEKMHWLTILGVLVGFGGLSLIFHEGFADFSRSEYRWGIAACFGSCLTWSIGTVMAKRFNQDDFSPVVNAGFQILSGGLALLLISLIFEPDAHLGQSWQTWGALVYLTLIGSALAFSLYMFTLKHLDATVSSLYTYINPIVAIVLGWAFLSEHLSIYEVIGIGITILGVFLVNRGSVRPV